MSKHLARLRVTRTLACPMYDAGAEIVIDLPEVSTNGCGVCALLVSQVLPALQPALLGDRQVEFSRSLQCTSGSARFAKFSVAIESESLPTEGISDSTVLPGEAPGNLNWLRGRRRRTAAVLSEVSIFAGLPDHKLDKLASLMEVRRFAPNTVVVEQGTVADGLHIVANGVVELYRTANDDHEQTLARRGRKYSFAERSLIESQAAEVTILSVQEVTTAHLSREAFFDLLQDDSILLEEMITRGFDEQLLEERLLQDRGQAERKQAAL